MKLEKVTGEIDYDTLKVSKEISDAIIKVSKEA